MGSTDQTRVEKDGTNNRPGRDTESHRLQKIKPHSRNGQILVGLAIGAAWVVPSVAEKWDQWWMQAIVWAFGLGCAYYVFGFLHETARWKILLAIVPPLAVFAVFSATMLIAYAGGTVPSYFRNANVRFVLPIILTVLALLSWVRALRPVRPQPATRGATTPRTQPASAPATQPASAPSAARTTPAPPHARRPVTLSSLLGEGPPRPCERRDFEYLTSISEFVDALHAHTRYLDSLLNVGQDVPDARAGVCAMYAIEAANMLGVPIPQPAPKRGSLVADEQKWFMALADAAMESVNAPTTPVVKAAQPTPQPSPMALASPPTDTRHPILRSENIARAIFGEGPDDTPDQWIDVTDRAKYLADLNPPVTTNLQNLQVANDFLQGTRKQLRITLKNDDILSIEEGRPLDLLSAHPVLTRPPNGRRPSHNEIDQVIRCGRDFCEAVMAKPTSVEHATNLVLKATEAAKVVHKAFGAGMGPSGHWIMMGGGWTRDIHDNIGDAFTHFMSLTRSLGWMQFLQGYSMQIMPQPDRPLLPDESHKSAADLLAILNGLGEKAWKIPP